MELTDFENYLIAKGYSRQSTKVMLRDVTYFLQWVEPQHIAVEQINYNDVTAYLDKLKKRGVCQRTQQSHLNQIKHYLNYLTEADLITHNPVAALKLKNTKRKTLHHIFTPEQLEAMYKTYRTEIKLDKHAPPQQANELSRKRNKVILGLIVYQGLNAEDLQNIETAHLQLREGKIMIAGRRRTNERILKLEAHQIFELYDYINETRKAILQRNKQETDKLFVTVRTGNRIQNAFHLLLVHLKEVNPRIKNLDQLRASVITNWLKQYNKRKVQYMAGHRYVSSTEAYEANNIEALQEDVEKYYPVM